MLKAVGTGWISPIRDANRISELGLEIGGKVLLGGAVHVRNMRRLRRNQLVAQLGHRNCEFGLLDFCRQIQFFFSKFSKKIVFKKFFVKINKIFR